MQVFGRIYHRLYIDIRNQIIKILAPMRLKRLQRQGARTDFTIISNNCWGGLVYHYFGLPYNSPTVGLFFFAHDYIKFLYNIREYIEKDLVFIDLKNSRYANVLQQYGGQCLTCPIAVCGDIEIIFMHYHSEEEAATKWKRRVNRINWDNMVYKFSEMNGCSTEDLKAFNSFDGKKKLVFTHKDYSLDGQIVLKEFRKIGYIPNDTDYFHRHVNLYELLGGK